MSLLATAVRFGVVGVATAVVHYGLLYIGVEFVRLGATLASSIGFVVSVVFNYLMHYSWTFAEPAPHGRTLVRYVLMVACGFGINALVMYVGVHEWGLHYLITQALALVTVVLWNFSLSNLWVFRA